MTIKSIVKYFKYFLQAILLIILLIVGWILYFLLTPPPADQQRHEKLPLVGIQSSVPQNLKDIAKQQKYVNKPYGFDPMACLDYAEPIRVNLRGNEFRIPDMYKPHLESEPNGEPIRMFCSCRNVKSENSNLLEDQKGYCQRFDAPPFDVSNIIIRQANFRKDDANSYSLKLEASTPLDKIFDPLDSKFPLLVNMGVLFYGYTYPYCKTKLAMDAAVNSWHKYKDAEGFYESGSVNREKMTSPGVYPLSQIMYYSDKHTFFGLPVIIGCDERETIGIDPSISLGRECESYIAISDTLAVSARFYDKFFPPSKWTEGFRQLGNFVRSIMVNPPKNIKFTSCDSIQDKEK